MSTETALWIVCDGCGSRWHSAPTPAAARKDAHAAGWSADKADDKDYCTVCTNDRIGEVYGTKQIPLPLSDVKPQVRKKARIEYDFGITHIEIGDEK